MSHRRFESLKERLLRGGIAPRHVRRYIGELDNHFDDLVQGETRNGVAPEAAREAASLRLGSDEVLAKSLLDRPELRSLTARYPWAVFGIGPVALLAVCVIAAVFLEVGFLHLHRALAFGEADIPHIAPLWLKYAVALWNGLLTFVLPLGIAGLMCVIGMRQLVPAGWIVAGVTIICVVGGFHEVELRWGDGARRDDLSVGFGLAFPYPSDLLHSGFIRAPANMALVAAAFWLWARRRAEAVTG